MVKPDDYNDDNRISLALKLKEKIWLKTCFLGLLIFYLFIDNQEQKGLEYKISEMYL